ncbi:hypothetical protein BRADI_3g30290v3 [Brachypodium distachyon]|uniref:Bifunctional inhibitor/plant lipid transfer protein/seed storage helical domain-containing protein n=1 Tax=Brachypodium distachyon TaxID=15368 RepID=I1I579_BRADI|nr:hypothetical protein BRADI_3g30290v3 [Brachypodium distachyon]
MARAAAICMVLAMVVVAATAAIAADQLPPECKVEKLELCKPAFISGAAPSESCCAILRAQDRCLCIYINGGYLSSHNVGKTVKACGLAIPVCPL